jgi:hypothetical protein
MPPAFFAPYLIPIFGASLGAALAVGVTLTLVNIAISGVPRELMPKARR